MKFNIDRSMIAFATVGSTTTFMNFFIFFILCEYFKIDYRISLSIAYVISVIFHFLGNRHFTFRASEQALKHQLGKYLVFMLISYLITLCVTWIGVQIFFLSKYAAALIGMGTAACIGYQIARSWVFKGNVST